MNDRIERLRAWLDDQTATAVLVTSAVNVRYLTGFESSSAALLVGAETVHLYTDARYGDAARAVEDVEPVILERSLFAELGGVLADHTAGPVAFESGRLTVAAHESLAKSSLELVGAGGALDQLRAVKDEGELTAIRRAADVVSEGLERVPQLKPVGKTEKELAWLLERLMREELGADGLSFPAIVASGANSSRPHHRASDRVIEPDELLLIDTGCVVDGYCSDCTRLYATGELPEALKSAYSTCLEIQQASVDAVRAGVDCRELDETYRAALEEHGYAVDHSLGHGVGAEIHEEPRLARTATGALEAGQVVTVEPGIYLHGVGGVRIEDMVIVGDGGGEVITPVTKELVPV